MGEIASSRKTGFADSLAGRGFEMPGDEVRTVASFSSSDVERMLDQAKWQVVCDETEIVELLERVEGWSTHPFHLAHWLAGCGRYEQRKGIRHVIVEATRDDQLLLVMPLCIEKRFGLVQLGWYGQSMSDSNGPFIRPDLREKLTVQDAASIWRKAAHLIGGVDIVNATKQPQKTSLGPNPFAALFQQRETDQSHYLIMNDSGGGDWEEIEKQIYSRHARKILRSKLRKLGALGDVAFVSHTDRAEAEDALEKLFAWKRMQLATQKASNPFLDQDFCDQLRAITLDGLEARQLRVFSVFLDGHPIAVEIVLCREHHWQAYQTAYDADYSKYSPGALLIHHIFEQACKNGVQIVDYGFGDTAYKQQVCNEHMMVSRTLMPLSPLGWLASYPIRWSLELKRYIKKNKKLKAFIFKASNIMFRDYREA